MFHCLYYSDTFDESKEKLKTAFCCFLVIEKIVALSSSNLPVKLICLKTFVINLFLLVYSFFDDTNNLIKFMLCVVIVSCYFY